LCGAESAPFGKRGVAIELEIVSAVERALLVEMVVGGDMSGDEFLQTSHAAEQLQGPFSSSSQRLMEALCPVPNGWRGPISLAMLVFPT